VIFPYAHNARVIIPNQPFDIIIENAENKILQKIELYYPNQRKLQDEFMNLHVKFSENVFFQH
jgi:hypothetical protein